MRSLAQLVFDCFLGGRDMWILVFCLPAIFLVLVLVWYLRRRWQWSVLFATLELLREGEIAPTITKLGGGGRRYIWPHYGPTQDIVLTYAITEAMEPTLDLTETRARIREELILSYYSSETASFPGFFRFCSRGEPRWRWRINGDDMGDMEVPKFARSLLEEILSLVQSITRNPLVANTKLRVEEITHPAEASRSIA